MKQRGHLLLLSAPRPRRLMMAGNLEQVRNAAACRELIVHGYDKRHLDLQEMLAAHEAAVGIARRLGPEDCGGAVELASLQGRAFAYLGNAQRALGKFADAGRNLRLAVACQASCDSDLELTAIVAEFSCSLAESRRDLVTAMRFLETAGSVRARMGDTNGSAKVLLKRGIIQHCSGDNERAVECIIAALDGMDAARAPDLARAAILSLTWCLIELGQLSDAEAILFDSEDVLAKGKTLVGIRLRWVRARLDFRRWREADARRALRVVQQDFADRNMGQEAGLVGLDRAALEFQCGLTGAARAALQDVQAFFAFSGIAREATMATLLGRALLEDEAQRGLALVTRLAGRLRHSCALRA